MGKTAAIFNIYGEKFDNDPAPGLWIGPTKSNIETVIVPQWDTMIDGCQALKEKLLPGRQKALLKKLAGTVMRFAWSGSATEIASMPAHTVAVDEVDKCEDIPGHGDVLVQAEARLSNYKHSGGILIATSSPTEGSTDVTVNDVSGLEHWTVSAALEISSKIWKQWQAGTRHEFMIPCPDCHEYFAPRLRYLTGWESGDSPAKAKRKAKLMHWRCGTMIEERWKESMLQRGLAIAPGQRVVGGDVVGEAPDSEWYSIHISGLLSPWVSWGDRAYAWIAAARSHDQETIRATINLGFGELYREKGEAPPWEEIKKISDESPYDLGLIPRGVREIFLSVDVQQDHLVCIVRGWGVEMESWLLAREELWGDTAEQDVWNRLDQMADKGFGDRPFNAFAVDSGFRTEQVYSWCERRLTTSYATKGKDAPQKLYSATDVEVLRSGKKIKRGLKLWTLDHGFMKGWVHDRIRWPQDQPGSWHLGRAVGEDYCRQLVGEQRMRLPSGKIHWVKSGVNDFLDAESLQVFLAHIRNIKYLKPDDTKPQAPTRGRVRSRGVEM